MNERAPVVVGARPFLRVFLFRESLRDQWPWHGPLQTVHSTSSDARDSRNDRRRCAINSFTRASNTVSSGSPGDSPSVRDVSRHSRAACVHSTSALDHSSRTTVASTPSPSSCTSATNVASASISTPSAASRICCRISLDAITRHIARVFHAAVEVEVEICGLERRCELRLLDTNARRDADHIRAALHLTHARQLQRQMTVMPQRTPARRVRLLFVRRRVCFLPHLIDEDQSNLRALQRIDELAEIR